METQQGNKGEDSRKYREASGNIGKHHCRAAHRVELHHQGPLLFYRHLPSSLTYPQARPLSLVVQGSAWGEGFHLSPLNRQCVTSWSPCVITVPILLSYHFLLLFHFLLAMLVFVIGQAPITVALINLALP